jgi:hypothetical protein
MNKSFIKFVDNSLLPASIMVIGKFLGVILTNKLFSIPWSVQEYSDSLFSFGTVAKAEDISKISSYSDLVMYIFISTLFLVNVVRAIYFHNTHIKPNLILKLANSNLLKLVTSSYEIYHAGFAALLFLWTSVILIWVNVFSDKTYLWVGIVTLFFTIALSIVLLNDVYREVENIKKHPGRYQWT